MAFEERTLSCQDCGQEFIFSAEEQEFFASKSFTEPKRCSTCRTARRSERNAGGSSIRARPMFPAVCATCGKATEVPFEPREGRPVYCRDCYTPRSNDRMQF
jgi:CxxC-x17-CxxC domain-containing protein